MWCLLCVNAAPCKRSRSHSLTHFNMTRWILCKIDDREKLSPLDMWKLYAITVNWGGFTYAKKKSNDLNFRFCCYILPFIANEMNVHAKIENHEETHRVMSQWIFVLLATQTFFPKFQFTENEWDKAIDEQKEPSHSHWLNWFSINGVCFICVHVWAWRVHRRQTLLFHCIYKVITHYGQ